jgi:hypothetical protein
VVELVEMHLEFKSKGFASPVVENALSELETLTYADYVAFTTTAASLEPSARYELLRTRLSATFTLLHMRPVFPTLYADVTVMMLPADLPQVKPEADWFVR